MLIVLAEAEMQEFDDWMLSDPIVAALGKVFVAREAAQHQQFEEKVRSITIERNMLHYHLQEKIKEPDRDIRTINKSERTRTRSSRSLSRSYRNSCVN